MLAEKAAYKCICKMSALKLSGFCNFIDPQFCDDFPSIIDHGDSLTTPAPPPPPPHTHTPLFPEQSSNIPCIIQKSEIHITAFLYCWVFPKTTKRSTALLIIAQNIFMTVINFRFHTNHNNRLLFKQEKVDSISDQIVACTID